MTTNSLAQEYLRRLMLSGLRPNFWVSLAYWDAADWEPFAWGDKAIGIWDADRHPMLPWLDSDGRVVRGDYWAGYPGMEPTPDLLDFQYVYAPVDFLLGKNGSVGGLSGGNFRPLRKAMAQCFRALGGWPVLGADIDEAAAESLLCDWAQGFGEGIYDPGILVKYLISGAAELRYMVRGPEGKPLAVIAADTNWETVNFRYCIVAPGIPGLAEISRALFWRHIAITRPDISWINDGGNLGRPGLKAFKDKLNPVSIQPIYQKESP